MFRVYSATREAEISFLDWSPEQIQAFVRQQFDAQSSYYQQNYSDATFDVVMVGGRPAGRLYVARWPDEIRIVDITLLPEFRGRGTGTWLIRQVLQEAAFKGLPVTIHVERFNPALALYLRLGFAAVEDRGVYLLMRHPGATGASASDQAPDPK
jgi:GNAT superfamily N-acetyltransferase